MTLAQRLRRRRWTSMRWLQPERLEPRNLLAADVFVSELMASNSHSLDDGNGASSDWIELHNAGDEPAELGGWHLTDDPRQPSKWTFPPLTLAAGQYVVVFASGNAQPDAAGQLHTNFRLSADGEYLAMTDDLGVTRQAFAPAFPPQFNDISYGFSPTAGPTQDVAGYLDHPTPGAINAAAKSNVTRDLVTFSQAGGTFQDSMVISLAAATGKDIYFTVDGSMPSTENAMVYVEPIVLDASTQIRARVIEADRVAGPVTTASYIRVTSEVAEFRAELPIMVIDNFGAGAIPNTGWNQTNTGIQQQERQSAGLMLFEASDSSQGSSVTRDADVSSRIGIRVRGAFSSSFDEPGYSVETWSESSDVDEDRPLLGIAADSDWVLYAPNPMFDRTLIDNSLMFEMSRQMGRWAPDVRYVEAFVNTDGEPLSMSDYVGLYAITEKVKRAPDRLDFERFAPDGSSGGWLLDINRMDSISIDGVPPRNFHTAGPDGVLQTQPDLSDRSSRGDDIPRQSNAYINFDDPNGFEINAVQRESISAWFQRMEDVLYGRVDGVDWQDPVDGYAKYIDVDNFIDYFILNDISHNGDGLLLSMWLLNPDPNGEGKLQFGPIWDADLGSFSGLPEQELMRRTTQLWYGRLFEDPNFMQRYTDRWQTLRRSVLTDDNVAATIDDLHRQIGDAAAARDGVSDWAQRLEEMKNWMSRRNAAIDELFVAPPMVDPAGGPVEPGTELQLRSASGQVYFTADGTDPRMPDGSIAEEAMPIDVEYSPLIEVSARASALVPNAEIDQLIGHDWVDPQFVESAAGETWTVGTTGVGYDRGTRYDPLIELDLGDVDRTVYIRIPFELDAAQLRFDSLQLAMQFDDGFVAYLNGTEVARANAPGRQDGAFVGFDAQATQSTRVDVDAFDVFDVSAGLEWLRPGTNVLAIQGLNVSETSSDLLIRPQLSGGQVVSPPITIRGNQRIVARTLLDGRWSGPTVAAYTVATGDFDGDGTLSVQDVDLLCAALMSDDAEFDLDGSGSVDQADVDVMIGSVLGTVVGDVNLDRVFDSGDLVLIFQAGEYEDNIVGNSTWSSGDWNCDGEFTSSDLVAALAAR